ncbi:acrosin-like [Limulus polyphemus]|uniref:Acrosin-like n=1 Tax=Limulus polyphemus TaxID=6850 RepID=A0ABM1BKV8_LIMPO|nr:acrosin-like [Limulus polyphemus]
MHPLGKQGYNQNASGHPGVSHGHHRIDGMGGMFQGKRMAQPRPPPPPQYMMNYGTPQGFPYTQYYPYPLHLPIPMANYHHQAFPQLFGNPPPPPPPQDPPLPREPPPPSPPPPPPPE